MLVRHGHDGRHLGQLAEEVHRDDGLGAGGDGGFHQGARDVEGFGVQVDEHRSGPQAGHDARGGEEGEGGEDHLVPVLDVQGHEGHQEGVGAAGHAHGVPGSRIFGQLGFQALDVLAQDEA